MARGCQTTQSRLSGLISIIIPVLNEAVRLPRLLDGLCGHARVEIIVVDGGSADGSAETARRCGATCIASARGRARQMNAGAAAATGDTLLFLHADTCLPADFARHVRETLAFPGVVAGAFELALDTPSTALRIIEKLANWRSRRLQLPYGDQALFLPTRLFREIGGFADIPIMEDVELIRRLHERGRIAIVPRPVVASARRWQAQGVLRTTLINQAALMAYFAGVSPARIARRYYGRPR